MINAEHLARAFGRNTKVLEMQAEGLSHADSLVQTPYNINCFNWTLGHILLYRDRAIALAGGSPHFDTARLGRYVRESDPITGDGEGVLPFAELVAAIGTTQREIDEAIGGLRDDEFGRDIEIAGKPVMLARRLHADYFHDTYHTGQTEILRQVAGTADKII